ncbi:helix-turn-helix transcriptional regulator [Streptomyces sp. FXJ1.172]|uniref:helix-turn-helix domain-containing protein n=1 Tax=Streptomyces sp. FXJ1.172 TaxID=710705 RepID=UPI0007CF2365|nr:helix-turn-helix transcriptional regulator [Streptomyces sp. FXJ1.172]WEO95794.1 helix-turn-helix transcriptional regulator [Streptomyces sp. FXJ1.172]
MSTEVNSQPPIAWRYCGSQIKMWRTEAGIGREALAKEAGYDYEYVKSMENGRRRPTLRLLQVADQVCGAGGKLVAAQEYLKPEPFPTFSQDFIRYESEAISLSSYEPLLIPGLLQTEETARSLLKAHWPPLDDETVEERVTARLKRQALLAKQTRSFSFVIGESALRNKVGGAEAHSRQLRHLLAAAEQRNVTVQVLPIVGAHPGLNGPLVLLETSEHEHFGYEEGQTTGVLYSDPDRVSIASQRHAMILRQALSLSESARFIGEVAEGQ